MLFNRHVAKSDAIIGGFVAATLAIFSMVVAIVVYANGNANAYLLSDLLLNVLVLTIGLTVAISLLKNDVRTAFIASAVGMPIYASAVLFGNIDIYMQINDLYHASFPLWLGFIWYIVAAIGLIECTFYLVAGLVKGRENPKFGVSANVEVNSFLLAGAGVCFAIAGGINKDWSYWGTFVGVLSEIALVESFASVFVLAKNDAKGGAASSSQH